MCYTCRMSQKGVISLKENKLRSRLEAVQEERIMVTEEQKQLQVALERIRRLKQSLQSIQEEIARIESDIEVLTSKIENGDMDDREANEIQKKLAAAKTRLNALMKEKMTLEWKLAEAEQDEEDLDEPEKNFDKKTCLANIRFLLSMLSVRLGDIETNAGVSIGYLSRLEKEGNKSDPSIEFLATAAKMLGVTLDTLLYAKLGELSNDEKYLIQFLTMLKIDTDEDKIVWEMESAESLNNLQGMPDAYSRPHPLFTLYGEDPGDLNYYFHTDFLPVEDVLISGPCYHTHVPKSEDTIYLTKVALKNATPLYDREFIEITHIDNDGTVFPICNTIQTVRQITEAANALYDRAANYASHIHFADPTRSLINGYLKAKLIKG